MKWVKVDQYTGKPIPNKDGWHICDYISGDYKIISDNGKWILTKAGKTLGTYKTLKAAKAEAEKI